MNYRVDWLERAEQALAAVWTAAADRAAVTEAARRLEQALGRNPFVVGESREDFDLRIAFDGPLVIIFRVELPARVAVVLAVRANG